MCSRVAFIKEGKIIKLEKMSTLHENSYKKISIEGKAPINKDIFNISGISAFKLKDNTVSFMFKGDINSIIKRIAAIDIRNISIDEPDLEEIFMHYYVKED